MCCFYQCKDTNFKANHNLLASTASKVLVVFTNAKILILKLITTGDGFSGNNSCCFYQCKDTNFNAIPTNDTSDLLF